MDIEMVIAQSEENIRQALHDYAEYTSQTDVLYDVSDAFIHRLAKDNAYAKRELRELFSQSPVYDAKLDALVINGTRTHDPDPSRIVSLVQNILADACGRTFDGHYFIGDFIWDIAEFFAYPESESARNDGLAVLQVFAPKAYKAGRKPSRVFKQLCQALGVADETAGSEFQRLYAQFADELTTRKIGFKLFVSLNPAHFITMSNPKKDERGNTLTSCHSFNSTEYSYNNGCTGYARDKWSFIVFTVADPSDAETLNNRKTTRQIFAYKPGNGVLLQSRLYNTSGGTTGAQEDSKLYRDLVQREISALEDAANLWRTFRCVDEDDQVEYDYVRTGCGFGGYEDWIYRDFHAHISVRTDHEEDFRPLEIGTYGICVCCAEENSDGVYCSDCENGESWSCDECGDSYRSDSDLYTVRNSRGEEILVCEDCRDRYYRQCEECGERFPNDDMIRTASGDYVCRDCLNEYYSECDKCGEYEKDEDMCYVINGHGEEVKVCVDCRNRFYTKCDKCGEYHFDDDMTEAFDGDGCPLQVCPSCLNEHFEACRECGEFCETSAMEDGLCPDCAAKTPTSEGLVDDDNNETEVSA